MRIWYCNVCDKTRFRAFELLEPKSGILLPERKLCAKCNTDMELPVTGDILISMVYNKLRDVEAELYRQS